MGYIKKDDMIELKEGQKYTMYWCSGMASTCRLEFEFVEFRYESYAQYEDTILMVFKQKGKRKLQQVRLHEETILFDGWDNGLVIDTDLNSFCMSATINFIGKKFDIISKLEKAKYIGRKGVIVFASKEKPHEQYVLYPDSADLSHAVIERIMAKGSELK